MTPEKREKSGSRIAEIVKAVSKAVAPEKGKTSTRAADVLNSKKSEGPAKTDRGSGVSKVRQPGVGKTDRVPEIKTMAQGDQNANSSKAEEMLELSRTLTSSRASEILKEAASISQAAPTEQGANQLASLGKELGKLGKSPDLEKARKMVRTAAYEQAGRLKLNDNQLRTFMNGMEIRPIAGGAPPGGASPFKDVDLSPLNSNPVLKKYIQSRIDFYDAAPNNKVDQALLQTWARSIEGQVANLTDPKEQAAAAGALEVIHRLISDDRIPNTISLTREEVREIISNPIGFFERYSQEIEKLIQQHGFDSPVVEQRLHRYRLIADYFSSDHYDAAKGLDLDKDVSPDDRTELAMKRDKLIDKKADMLRQYSDRLHIMEFNYILSNVSDFEKDTRLSGVLDRIGDGGGYGSRTHWGGLSEVAVQKIRRIHGEMLRDPGTARRFRSVPDLMRDVIDKAAKELFDEKDIWKPQYEHYLKQLIAEGGDFISIPEDYLDKQIKDETTWKAIARIGAGSYQLFFEKQQVMASGTTPAMAKYEGGINQFITANPEERMLATFRIRDWFFRKWTNMYPGQKAMWNERALFYIHKDPELSKWAREKTDILWEKFEKWQKLPYDFTEKDQAMNDLKDKHPFYAELRTIFSEYENPTEMGTSEKDKIRFFNKLKKDKLYHYVAADIGGEWAQMHGIKAYGYWESGGRRDSVYDGINASVHYKGHAEKLFLGKDIIEKANDHFHPSVRRRSIENEDKFKNVLKEAIKYHPHTFFKMRNDEFRLEMGEAGGALFKDVTRRFDVIQSQLMLQAVKPIDYSMGYGRLSDEQRAIVDRTFQRAGGVSRDQYFNEMKMYHDESYKHLTGGDKLPGHDKKGFAHVRYASAFSFLLFTDDIPLAGIEMPSLVRASGDLSDADKQHLQKQVPLSRQSVEGGRGSAGLWRRAWADFVKASGLVPVEIDTLTNNEKVFSEAIVKLGKTIPSYQSNIDGAIAVIEASAGYLKAAKTKDKFGSLLKGMGNSSIMKEFWSNQDMSLSIDELSHMWEKFNSLLFKFKSVSPAFGGALESFVGLTNWRDVPVLGGDNGLLMKALREERFDHLAEFFNEHVPHGLYIFKSRNVMLFAMLIMLMYVADQGKKGGQEKEH